jgi:hypothetical protein
MKIIHIGMDFIRNFLLKLFKPTVYHEKRQILIITKTTGKPWLGSFLLELVSGTSRL